MSGVRVRLVIENTGPSTRQLYRYLRSEFGLDRDFASAMAMGHGMAMGSRVSMHRWDEGEPMPRAFAEVEQ